MENDADIIKLRKLLNLSNEDIISSLLIGCTSYLDESSTFGSRSWSRRSTFQIYAPLPQLHKLKKLTNSQQKILMNHVTMIYPTRDNAPEIYNIDFLPTLESLDDHQLVEPENLMELNLDFVTEQINKCRDKINSNDYDGALTNARSLLESVCIYILEKNTSEKIKSDGKLNDLYKKVAVFLDMDTSIYENTELKKIISGSFGIVTGITALRNSMSDSHGKSSLSNSKIPKHHAVLVVNLAKSISEFLISSVNYREDLKR